MALPERTSESEARERAAAALATGSHVHIIGICGTATAGAARLLADKGFRVTGSDKAFYPPMGDVIRQTADQIYEGYRAENLDDVPDFVVIGNSVRSDNPEVLATHDKNISYCSLPELFSAFLIGSREHCPVSIVCAGTHGKTTTSAAVATVLNEAGRAPGYFIGGVPCNLPSAIRAVSDSTPVAERVVVLEGDEYDSAYFAKWPKFHSYRPDIAICTSLEFDHADIYRDVEEIALEFTRLARRIPKDGVMLVCDSYPELQQLAKRWREDSEIVCDVQLYGMNDTSEWRLVSRSPDAERGGQSCVISSGHTMLSLWTPLTGEHNAMNLVAVAAACARVGLSDAQIIEGAAIFSGVVRRQQVVFDRGNITVVEDFAHHPTAVATTLAGLREQYPNRRLLVAFEPRSNTSRRAVFQKAYQNSFSTVDEVFILRIADVSGYSNTGAFEGLDVDALADGISKQGPSATAFSSVDELASHISNTLASGDVLIVMSNGDFGGLLEMVRASLEASIA